MNSLIINNVNEVDISGSITFNNLVEKPSGPVLVFAERFCMVFVTISLTGVKVNILFVLLIK